MMKLKNFPGITKVELQRYEDHLRVHGYLMAVKNAWRNPSFHPCKNYTVEEAEDGVLRYAWIHAGTSEGDLMAKKRRAWHNSGTLGSEQACWRKQKLGAYTPAMITPDLIGRHRYKAA